MKENQRTIQKEISLVGRGLHTGENVTVRLKPAEVDRGVFFKRVDLPDEPIIPANFENVLPDASIPRCTSLGKGDVAIHTVEHLLGALCAHGIDNLCVEINGIELPGLDGSSIEFFNAIQEAGIVEQEKDKDFIEIKEPIGVYQDNASIFAVPAQEYRISYVLDYNHPQLQPQYFNIKVDRDSFEKDIGPSRTFCLEQEAQYLRDMGLGKGANYQNTLVVGLKGVVDNDVRFPDEFARHKVLDFIGDLYLLGKPLKGRIYCARSGHGLNLKLLKKIIKQQKHYNNDGLSRNSFLGSELGEKCPLNVQEIMNILPHRYPFLLVDRIASLEKGKRAIGIKNVSANEQFFIGHFPQRPLMPGVLLVEAMAQVGGILVLTSDQHQGKLGLFMATDKVKFRKMVVPGDQLIMDVEIIRDRSRMALLHGTTTVKGEVVAEADIAISFVESNFLSQGESL